MRTIKWVLIGFGVVYFSGLIPSGCHYSAQSIDARDNASARMDSVNLELGKLESIISKTKKEEQAPLLSQKTALRAQITTYDSLIKASTDDKTKAKNFFKSLLSWGYLAD